MNIPLNEPFRMASPGAQARRAVNITAKLRGVALAVAVAGAWAFPVSAAVVTMSFQGTVSVLTGGDGRVRVGDAFNGVLTLDTSYPYNRRIDEDRARFIWWAWIPYLGPPSVPPPPLPVTIGFENMRTGERFDVPVPGAPYDYRAIAAPSSTIDFALGNFGQRLDFNSYVQSPPRAPDRSYLTLASLALAGAEDALFDGLALDLITAQPASVNTALSSARYATEGLDFTLALTRAGSGSATTVPEPGGLALVGLGLLALGVARRRAQGTRS